MAVSQPVTAARGSSAVSARQWMILVSPILVVGVSQLAGRWFAPLFGGAAIYAWLLVYWALTGALIFWGAGREGIKRWAGRPRGSWLWSALALIFLPVTLPIFFEGWPLILQSGLWLPWLLFAPINSFFEEGYWRGLLLDAARPAAGRRLPGWAVMLYASLFFTLNHTALAAIVLVYQGWYPLISPVIAGLLYSLVYWKTGSLRWAVVSHTLVNWFGLGMLVLLNVYIPPTP